MRNANEEEPVMRDSVFVVPPPARSGYCLQFQVYTGETVNTQEKGLSYRVVTELLANFQNKNNHICFENFFTTIPLLEDLAVKGTLCCGTIRADCGKFPENFKKCKLSSGDCMFISKENLLAVHWKDKRGVPCINNSWNSDRNGTASWRRN